MVFSYAILIGISLIYYSTGQTDISKAFMIINIYNTDPSLSILLVLIHLFTHAFFKGLLFLAAGAVIHSVANEQNIYKLGGLNKVLPLSYIFILIGSLSLMG